MKKALLAGSDKQAFLLRKHVGEGWDVIAPYQALCGVLYSVLIVPTNLASDPKLMAWLNDLTHRFSYNVKEVG